MNDVAADVAADTPMPGLVDRVDHLTAAVADLAFKLETLISSTTAFRESFGERMTDYADLVAHWSIETEDNLARQRSVSERLVGDLHRGVDSVAENLGAEIAKVERRVLEAVEANTPEPVSLPAMPEPIDHTDAIAAVLAEVTSVRESVPTVDLAPLAEEVRGLRRDLARLPDISPVADEVRQLREALLAEPSEADDDRDNDERDASLAEAVGEQLLALRTELAAVKERVAERPPVPPEVLALTEELQALRREMDDVVVADEPPPPSAVPGPDPVQEVLAELVYEVKALRRRFPVKAPEGEYDPTADEPPPVPPSRASRKR
jgi:predicted nuclease with TOPRIM domain